MRCLKNLSGYALDSVDTERRLADLLYTCVIELVIVCGMYRLVSAMILCPVKDTKLTHVADRSVVVAPFAVSVVKSSCRRPGNAVIVGDLRRRSAADAVNFSVCVPPIFGNFNDVQDLVEFIEVYRVLGVQKFQIYVSSVGPQLDRCLQEYVRRDIVDVQSWVLPASVSGIIYYSGQILAINECLYRLMYRTRYVVIQDLDEFVVPMRSDSWQSMLDIIHKHMMTDSDRIASYNFQHRFFPTELPKATSITPADGIKRRQFKTLSVMKADEFLFPYTDRSKVMVRPERLIIFHVHLILDSSLVRIGDINARVDPQYGQLFHYRRGMNISRTTSVSRMKTFEESILRRLYVATAAVCLTGDYQYP